MAIYVTFYSSPFVVSGKYILHYRASLHSFDILRLSSPNINVHGQLKTKFSSRTNGHTRYQVWCRSNIEMFLSRLKIDFRGRVNIDELVPGDPYILKYYHNKRELDLLLDKSKLFTEFDYCSFVGIIFYCESSPVVAFR